MARMKRSAVLDHLLNGAVHPVKNIPLLHSFERIVRGQNAFDPELDKFACRWIDDGSAWMPLQHPDGAFFARDSFDGRAPSASVIFRVPIIGYVNGIGPAEAMLNRDHRASRSPRVIRAGHHRRALSGRASEHFAGH